MNHTNERPRVACGLVAVVLGAGVLGATLHADPALAQTGAASGTRKAVRAEVVKPERRPVVRELMMPASLRADEQVDLYAKVSGYVGAINVDLGSRVRQGDVLATLDVPEMADELRQVEAIVKAKHSKVRALEAKATQADRMVDTARAEVQSYEARHDLDQINLKRQEELRAGNAIPEQALDEAKSAHAIAEAQLDIAKAQVAGAEAEKEAVLADVEVAKSDLMVAEADVARVKTLMTYARIQAPFDGVITMRKVDRGTFVRSAAEGSTTPLLAIAKTDRIRVVLEIPEVDAPYVRVGTPVRVQVRALGEHPFPGMVSRIAQALKPETRTMRAEVDLDNGDGRLAPGMYAQVTVELESKVGAMVIPSKAIRIKDKNTVVFVAAGGVATSMPVEIGYDDGIWAEIVSGLSGEEAVITATSGAVVPGAAVQTIPSGS